MNRRAVITAGPLAGLAAALVAGDVNGAVVEALSVGEQETPVMQAYREWLIICDRESNAPPEMDEAEFEALIDLRSEHENRLMRTPCQTARDWVIKATVWTDFGGFCLQDEAANPELWAEARALIG